jgi:hypothetical protein
MNTAVSVVIGIIVCVVVLFIGGELYAWYKNSQTPDTKSTNDQPITHQTEPAANAPSTVPTYAKPPVEVCGANYMKKPAKDTTIDCMRSMWLGVGCTTKGTNWKGIFDPSVSGEQYTTSTQWWRDRDNIGQIYNDMSAYYVGAMNGDAHFKEVCGV